MASRGKAGLPAVERDLENGDGRKYADAFLALMLDSLKPEECVSAARMADRLQELYVIECAAGAVLGNRSRAAAIGLRLGNYEETMEPKKAEKIKAALGNMMRCPHVVDAKTVAEWAGVTVPETAVAPQKESGAREEARTARR